MDDFEQKSPNFSLHTLRACKAIFKTSWEILTSKYGLMFPFSNDVKKPLIRVRKNGIQADFPRFFLIFY